MNGGLPSGSPERRGPGGPRGPEGGLVGGLGTRWHLLLIHQFQLADVGQVTVAFGEVETIANDKSGTNFESHILNR